MSWSDVLPQNFYLGLGVFLLVLTLVIISKRYYENKSTPAAMVKKGASLVRMCADAAYLSQETQNPLVAFSKATQAKAYLNVAQALANEAELAAEAKVAIADLQSEVDAEEKRTRQKLVAMCPQVTGQTRVAKMAGWTPPSTDDPLFTPL